MFISVSTLASRFWYRLKIILQKPGLILYIVQIFKISAIFYVVSAFFDLNDFPIGRLMYYIIFQLYHVFSNVYMYLCICICAFVDSYFFPDSIGHNKVKDKITIEAKVLILCYFIATPSFSAAFLYISVLFPFAYLIFLCKHFQTHDIFIKVQELGIFSSLSLIVFRLLLYIDRERLLVFAFEVCLTCGLPFLYEEILLFAYSHTYTYPRLSNPRKKAYNNYTDIRKAYLIVRIFLFFFIIESIIENIYERVPVVFYLPIACGYSTLLHIAYCLHSKQSVFPKGKHFYFFLSQVLLIKYLWVCWIYPY